MLYVNGVNVYGNTICFMIGSSFARTECGGEWESCCIQELDLQCSRESCCAMKRDVQKKGFTVL